MQDTIMAKKDAQKGKQVRVNIRDAEEAILERLTAEWEMNDTQVMTRLLAAALRAISAKNYRICWPLLFDCIAAPEEPGEPKARVQIPLTTERRK
jgi:hypothetical protein